MGFLDRLLKGAAQKAISEVAQSAMDAISDAVTDATGGNRMESDHAYSRTAPTASVKNTYTPAGPYAASISALLSEYPKLFDDDLENKLEVILTKEFSEYTFQKKVATKTPNGMPYSYAVYKDGIPKLYIMMVGKNTCIYKAYGLTKEDAAADGVTLINFVIAFENRLDYMVERLHQYL